MDNNIWYFFCADSCKSNKDKQKELIDEINTNLDDIEENSRVSCLTYNNKILLHYDYNYKDVEHLDSQSIIFKNETMSFYDLLGDIFLKILENKITYKKIVCNIYAYKLNTKEKIYTRPVIENLFNTINNKTPIQININLINQEIILIKDIFNISYTEPQEYNIKMSQFSNSSSRRSNDSERNTKKSIYFNIHIRN